MKLDKVMKDLCKSLKMFEHPTIRLVLIVVLVIYCSGLIKQVNRAVSSVVRDDIVKLIVIVVITLVALKDPVLAILLTLALVLSLNTNEYMTSEGEHTEKQDQEHIVSNGTKEVQGVDNNNNAAPYS